MGTDMSSLHRAARLSASFTLDVPGGDCPPIIVGLLHAQRHPVAPGHSFAASSEKGSGGAEPQKCFFVLRPPLNFARFGPRPESRHAQPLLVAARAAAPSQGRGHPSRNGVSGRLQQLHTPLSPPIIRAVAPSIPALHRLACASSYPLVT